MLCLSAFEFLTVSQATESLVRFEGAERCDRCMDHEKGTCEIRASVDRIADAVSGTFSSRGIACASCRVAKQKCQWGSDSGFTRMRREHAAAAQLALVHANPRPTKRGRDTNGTWGMICLVEYSDGLHRRRR